MLIAKKRLDTRGPHISGFPPRPIGGIMWACPIDHDRLAATA
jgi:hypothetical protein